MEVKCFDKYLALTQATGAHFYALKKIHLTIARTSNHVKFLKRCRRWNIIPKFLFLRLPFQSKRSQHLRLEFARKLLKELLENQKAKLARLLNEEIGLRCYVFSHTDLDQWDVIWNYISTLEEKEFLKVKIRQQAKFETLFNASRPHPRPSCSTKSAVVNLSQRTLDSDELDLLSKGLNFIPFNTNFCNLNLAVNVEFTFQKTKEVIDGVVSTLQSDSTFTKIGSDNLSLAERRALTRLRKDTSICIIQSDKGKNVVILDKSQYEKKLDDIVLSSSYEKLSNDPSLTIDQSLRHITRDLKKLPNVPNNIAQRLIGHNSRNPSIYGQPKIHKHDIPLRPIITTFGTVFENSAKFISSVLKFYQLNHEIQFSVLNSHSVLNNINLLDLSGNYILVSFDVTNLFGSLDIYRCRKIIFDLTSEDPFFEQRFQIPQDIFMKILDINLKSSFFEYKGEFFKQTQGVPMGSPCSPAIADLYMKDVEKQISLLPEFKSVALWNRYVDDVLSMWKGTLRQLDIFLNKLNKIDHCIKFTMEVETNGSLPFLDLLLTKSKEGLQSNVYHKPTDSGLIINYRSFQPPSVKVNTIAGETRRYVSISHNVKNDLNHLVERFVQNGYPEHLVSDIISKTKISTTIKNSFDPQKPILSLPYLGKVSNKINKITKRKGVQLVSKNNPSLGSIFGKNFKNRTQKDTNIVYEISCMCGEIYIGETSKTLSVRIKQHKNSVKIVDENNGIAVHVALSGHKIDWDSARILDFETNFKKRKIKEALYIKIKKPSLNLNEGLKLRSDWTNNFLKI